MSKQLCLVLAAACLTGQAIAQRAPSNSQDQSVQFDSKWLDNTSSTSRVVYTTTIKSAGAPWMRLFFGPTNLPTGSSLRLTSLDDNAVQRFDAFSLAEWENGSAFFNGGAVKLELVAGPGTKANRVLVTRVRAGIAPKGSPESICGSRDDRVRSSDKRQGRLSTGCTGWLNNSDVMLTAGHCVGSNMILSFNVPLSSSTGALRASHPNDQYPVVSSTVRRLSSGVGADWAVARMGKNSNTGKLPGDAQGSWYSLGAVPTTAASIRITGYGTTSPRNSLNQVQKTHVGPRYSTGSTHISYRTDTTGGNSGSPVVHENTGKVVGIHTHGGCNATSSNSRNYGTRIDRSDLQYALRNLNGVAGKSEPYGAGCKGSNGNVPALSSSSNPQIGRLGSVTVRNLLPVAYGFFIFGTSNTRAKAGYRLPFDLGIIGMTGCKQLSSASVYRPIFSGISGTTGWIGYIPRDPNMVGTAFYCQYFSRDRRANAAGTTASNGLKVTFGGAK